MNCEHCNKVLEKDDATWLVVIDSELLEVCDDCYQQVEYAALKVSYEKKK